MEMSRHEAKVLEVLRQYIAEHGITPTRVQLIQLLGTKSKGGITHVLQNLRAKGFISYSRGSRHITILDVCPYCGQPRNHLKGVNHD